MKKYVISSFLFHLCAITLMLLVTNTIDLRKRFIVYGAHSKKPTHAYFKPIKGGPKTNWLQKRQELEKKKRPKKKKKAEPKPNKETPKKKAKATVKKTPSKKQTTIRKKVKTKVKKKSEPKKQPEPKKASTTPKQEKQTEEELHFNLIDAYDPELARYHKHIQKEVERVWRPPVGVPKGTECSILFHVDKKGNVQAFEIKKKSSVLIYDLSVIRVAKNFHFDKCLWNKKFTIDFRQ